MMALTRNAMRIFVLTAGSLGLTSAATGTLTIDFEGLANGQHLDTPWEVSTLYDITAAETHSPGPAIFDSTPSGPNAGSQDPDLLTGTGNVLILQERELNGVDFTSKTGDTFDRPNDEAHGGTILFAFAAAVAPLSVDLIDIDPGSHMVITMTDTGGRRRTYDVPDNWTTDLTVAPQGWQRLDLTTLADQPAEPSATGGDATATEEEGFRASQVVRMAFTFDGSGAIDNLRVNLIPEPGTGWLVAAVAVALLLAAGRLRRPGPAYRHASVSLQWSVAGGEQPSIGTGRVGLRAGDGRASQAARKDRCAGGIALLFSALRQETRTTPHRV